MFAVTLALLGALWLNPLVALANSPPDPKAAKPEFTIIADEREVVIPVWHGSGANYSRSIRLTARSTDPTLRDEGTFSFLANDLINQKDGTVLDRQNVTLEPKSPTNTYKVLLNTPTNFQVKVVGLEVPGTYTGQIEFWPQGAGREKSLKLPLIVKALPAQPLVFLSSSNQLTLHLSRGFFSTWLLPTETINKRELSFENPYRVTGSLAEKDVILNEETTGYRLTAPQVEAGDILKQGQQYPAIINVPLDLKRDRIPPARYAGFILLKIDGAKEALKVPVTLTMRYGPGLAVILLLVGIITGWFVHWMSGTGLALAKLEHDWNNLRDQFDRLAPEDREILIEMVYKVRREIDNNEQAKAGEDLKKIQGRLELLELMHKIEKCSPASHEQGFKDIVADIRKHLYLEDDEKAKSLLDVLKNYTPTPEVQRLINMFEARQQPTAEKTWWQKFWQERKWTLLKWGFYVLILLVFTYVGLATVYLKNLTFGASPITDYASLFLWGFGSDVASRNLQNVVAKLPSPR